MPFRSCPWLFEIFDRARSCFGCLGSFFPLCRSLALALYLISLVLLAILRVNQACPRQSDSVDAKPNISHAYGIHKISTETSRPHVYYLRPLFFFLRFFASSSHSACVCVCKCASFFSLFTSSTKCLSLSLYPRCVCARVWMSMSVYAHIL